MKSYVFTAVNESLTAPLYSTQNALEFARYMESKRDYLNQIDTRYPNLVDFESFGRGMTRTLLVVREVANPYYLQAGFYTPYPRKGSVFSKMTPSTKLPQNYISFSEVADYLMALCKIYKRHNDIDTLMIINEVSDFLESYAIDTVETANGNVYLAYNNMTFNPNASLWEQNLLASGYSTRDSMKVASALLESYSLTAKFNYIERARELMDTQVGMILNQSSLVEFEMLPIQSYSVGGVPSNNKSLVAVNGLYDTLNKYLGYWGNEDRVGYNSNNYNVQEFFNLFNQFVSENHEQFVHASRLPAISIDYTNGTKTMFGARSSTYVYSEDILETLIGISKCDIELNLGSEVHSSVGEIYFLELEKIRKTNNNQSEEGVKFYDRMSYNQASETFIRENDSLEMVELSALFLDYQRLIGNMQYYDDYVVDYIRSHMIFDIDLNIDGLLKTEYNNNGGHIYSITATAKVLNSGLEYVVFEEGSRLNTMKVTISDLTSGSYDYETYSAYISNQYMTSNFYNKIETSYESNPHFAGSRTSQADSTSIDSYQEFSQVSYGRVSTEDGLGVGASTANNSERVQFIFDMDLKSQINMDYEDFFINKNSYNLQMAHMREAFDKLEIRVKGTTNSDSFRLGLVNQLDGTVTWFDKTVSSTFDIVHTITEEGTKITTSDLNGQTTSNDATRMRAYSATSSNLVDPSQTNGSWINLLDTDGDINSYPRLYALDSSTMYIATSDPNEVIAQVQIDFDIIAHLEEKYGNIGTTMSEKINWAIKNVKYAKLESYQWGSGQKGRGSSLTYWNHRTGTYVSNISKNVSSSPSKLEMYVDLLNAIDESNGVISFLAYAPVSGLDYQSVLHIDYVKATVELNSLLESTLFPYIGGNGKLKVIVQSSEQTSTPINLSIDYFETKTHFEKLLIKNTTAYKPRSAYISEVFVDSRNLDQFIQTVEEFSQTKDLTSFEKFALD